MPFPKTWSSPLPYAQICELSECELYIIRARMEEWIICSVRLAKMNKVLEVIVAFLSILIVADGIPAKYTSKYDNFDIEQVLRNDRLLNNYVKCLLDRGPCTPQGAELKRNLAEALKTGCSKCTDTQKMKSQKALNYIRANKKEIWKELEAKYDPDHVVRARTDKRKTTKNGPR